VLEICAKVCHLFSESLIDGVECFPGGAVCDIIRIRERHHQHEPKRHHQSRRRHHHRHHSQRRSASQTATSSHINTDLEIIPRVFTFKAFRRKFRLALRPESRSAPQLSPLNAVGNNTTSCVYTGKFVNKENCEEDEVAINLCGSVGLVSDEFKRRFRIIQDVYLSVTREY
jgi:hypothetical protein